MTTTKVEVVVATAPSNFGASTTAGKYLVGARNATTGQELESRIIMAAPFILLGDYTIGAQYRFFAQRLDSFGNGLATEVATTLTVPTPSGNAIDVPVSISLAAA